MESRFEDVGHWPMRSIGRLFLGAMLAVPLAFYASISNQAYAGDTRSKISVPFQKCATGSRAACVVDGDTIWLDGEKIRIADIDTPEVSEPKCSSELVLGKRATDRMLELINDGPFELKAWPGRDADRYGRKLRVLVRDSRSLGDILVSEGLARTWSGRREPWC
ncbi:thermonuclease family protein [Ciceribacter sp. T2.26MG-112.2]|uniref:thermonuclease family protein n=1 Tax=Ciceribacter sp. T2.26MG-112.2 TaxID=3137154 RepID=UPI001E326513|nr:thermonuclease family protein [Ciceribacter naphthalenivorans]